METQSRDRHGLLVRAREEFGRFVKAGTPPFLVICLLFVGYGLYSKITAWAKSDEWFWTKTDEWFCPPGTVLMGESEKICVQGSKALTIGDIGPKDVKLANLRIESVPDQSLYRLTGTVENLTASTTISSMVVSIIIIQNCPKPLPSGSRPEEIAANLSKCQAFGEGRTRLHDTIPPGQLHKFDASLKLPEVPAGTKSSWIWGVAEVVGTKPEPATKPDTWCRPYSNYLDPNNVVPDWGAGLKPRDGGAQVPFVGDLQPPSQQPQATPAPGGRIHPAVKLPDGTVVPEWSFTKTGK